MAKGLLPACGYCPYRPPGLGGVDDTHLAPYLTAVAIQQNVGRHGPYRQPGCQRPAVSFHYVEAHHPYFILPLSLQPIDDRFCPQAGHSVVGVGVDEDRLRQR
jgi:hypothetical protein